MAHRPQNRTGDLAGTLIAFVGAAFFVLAPLAEARPIANPRVWLAPPDMVTQPQSTDFQDLYEHPGSWAVAAKQTDVFSVPVNYLTQSRPENARRLLQQLAASGIRLNVAMLILEVDKKVCGDGIEGMVWPGEVEIYAKALRGLGADVDSFAFDLPLTNGTLSSVSNACRLPVEETARRLAKAVATLKRYYPHAKMYDAEVPTGLETQAWSIIFARWLDAYKAASGVPFDGVTLDVWYHGDWIKAVNASSVILKRRTIQLGVFLDASQDAHVSPAEWINEAKSIDCRLAKEKEGPDYIVVANWLDLRVKTVPDSDPNTLTGLLDWTTHKDRCIEIGPPPK